MLYYTGIKLAPVRRFIDVLELVGYSVKRARKILDNLREIKSAVFFKNKENILSGSEPPVESEFFK